MISSSQLNVFDGIYLVSLLSADIEIDRLDIGLENTDNADADDVILLVDTISRRRQITVFRETNARR